MASAGVLLLRDNPDSVQVDQSMRNVIHRAESNSVDMMQVSTIDDIYRFFEALINVTNVPDPRVTSYCNTSFPNTSDICSALSDPINFIILLSLCAGKTEDSGYITPLTRHVTYTR